MTEKTNIRSGMLSMIYQMLPSIDDDYAAKLVYTLENKKSISQLQRDILDTSLQLGSAIEAADTLAAKILLDEITVPAALHQLRVYQNILSIEELATALKISPEDTNLLLNYYASFGASHFFDTAFANALLLFPVESALTDTQKAYQALDKLLKAAKQDIAENEQQPQENKKSIYQVADQYHLSIQSTAALLAIYTISGAGKFALLFQDLFERLQKINDAAELNASLVARSLLCQITPKDAQDITLTSRLINGKILEEDLITIACRYLKLKTPQDIADTFNAVLQRLPHISQKEENLGLAVRVLLDGTEPMFERAQQKASLERERLLLRKALKHNELFSGYEDELSQRFAGQKNFAQLEQDIQSILEKLPYCQNATENKEIACKILLGKLSQEDAKEQANYLRDLKAKTLTKGLAPQALKNYLGTKPAEEIMDFFEKSLAPYTFWKSNQSAHEFALQTLVNELNGSHDKRISTFVLDMLESGSSLELVSDMLSNISSHTTSQTDLDTLLSMYKKARATTSNKS